MLAVAGGKGGCGKTTTALALGLATESKAVVVDADRDMPNLHAMAGVEREPTAEAVGQGAAPQPVSDTLSVVPAPPASTDDAAVPLVLDAVERATEGSVIVDCPGGSGPDAAAPLSTATDVVLVSTSCAPALRDAAKTAAMARALGCHVRGAVLSQTSVAPRGVESLLDSPVLGTVPTVSGSILTDERLRHSYGRIERQLSFG